MVLLTQFGVKMITITSNIKLASTVWNIGLYLSNNKIVGVVNELMEFTS